MIKPGSYGESLDIAGRNVHVEIEGYVDLSGPRPVEVPDSPPPVFDTGSATNH